MRLFHWSLVAAVIGLFITGETFRSVHVRLGYFVIFLVLARIIWGVVGTPHARFSDFIYPPQEILSYLSGLIKGQPKHYLGHNPAGGLMVIVLLLFLLLTIFSGLIAFGAKGQGPLANLDARTVSMAFADREDHEEDDEERGYEKSGHGTNEADEFWEEVHEGMTAFMLFLICLHVGGVAVSSWRHRENLVLAMLTGNKKVE